MPGPNTNKFCQTIALALGCLSMGAAHAVDYTWDGGGDGVTWSDSANWDVGGSYPDDTNDTATIPAPGAIRYITNDVVISIDKLTMDDSANNRLVLATNMSVRFYDGNTGGHTPQINMNGHTLTVERANSLYFAELTGGGELYKTGTDTVTLNNENNFTGRLTVAEGLLYIRSSHWEEAAKLTVLDGGAAQRQAQLASPTETRLLPPHIEINGNGFGPDGALSADWQDMCSTSRITVASDARITIDDGDTITFTLKGDIDGPGVLTLEPKAGVIDITGSGITYSNTLVITNGWVNFIGIAPNITNIVVKNGGVLAGGVFHFMGVVDGGVTNVTVEPGGLWIDQAVGQWTGNGDPDNSGNWSDTNNWSEQAVPVVKAILAGPSVDRYVTNDVASFITTLDMADENDNYLVVDAPMTIATFKGGAGGSSVRCIVNSTLTMATNASSYIFSLYSGTGTVVMIGEGQLTSTSSQGWQGDLLVSNGIFKARGGNISAWSNVTVDPGATFWIENPTPKRGPTSVTIAGDGSGAYSAFYNNYADQAITNLVVAMDASVDTARKLTIDGTLSGPGVLVKQGTDALNLNNAWTYTIQGPSASSIIASNGAVNVTNCTLNVNPIGPSQKEHVIIDFSGGGSVVGPFAATNGIASDWWIDYDGTDLHPDAVVLILGRIPAVDNSIGAVLGTNGTATLYGRVSYVGEPSTDGWIFWGTTNGHTNIPWWDMGGSLHASYPLLAATNSPAASSTNTTVGDQPWSSTTNIYASDDSYATAPTDGSKVTHYLVASNFGFDIPVTAIVTGIQVRVERKASVDDKFVDYAVNLVLGDDIGAENKADTDTKWGDFDAYANYGGAADRWSTNWGAASINSSNMGVGFSAEGRGGETAYVDHVEMTVYYTLGGTFATNIAVSTPGTYWYRTYATNDYGDAWAVTSVPFFMGPDMGIIGKGGYEIADGDTSPSVADGTDFGAVSRNSSKDQTFTVTNAGNMFLYLTNSPSAIVVGGAHSNDFIIVGGQPETNIYWFSNVAFTVRFRPTANGSRTGMVTVLSNDPDEDPYTFTTVGVGDPPEYAPGTLVLLK